MITPSKIFFTWFLTALAGSILFSIVIPMMKEASFYFIEYLLYFTTCWLLGSLFYLPALIVLLLVSQNNESRSLQQQYRALIKAHFLAFLVTFLAGNAWILKTPGSISAAGYLTLAICIYAGMAIVVWWFAFKKVRRQIMIDKFL